MGIQFKFMISLQHLLITRSHKECRLYSLVIRNKTNNIAAYISIKLYNLLLLHHSTLLLVSPSEIYSTYAHEPRMHSVVDTGTKFRAQQEH